METNNKYQELVKYLAADEARAAVILALPAEEACAKMNGDGLNISVEDLHEFDGVMEKIAKMGTGDELNEDALDAVSGGEGVTVAMVLGAMATLGGAVAAIEWFARKGYQIGRWIRKKFLK